MVSTHAWKAAISSPPQSSAASATQSTMFSPGAASPFASTSATTTGFGGAPGSALRPFIGGSDHKSSGGAAVSAASASGAGVGGGAPVADFGSLLASSSSLLSSMHRSPATMNVAGASASGGSVGMGGAAVAGGGGGGGAGVNLGDKSLLELSVASRAAAAAGSATGPTAAAAGPDNATGGATNTMNMGGVMGGMMGGLGAFGAPSSSSTTYEAEASAHRLLAREGYGFDSARLGRTAREFERRAGAASGAAGGGFGGRMEEEKKDGSEPGVYGGAGGMGGMGAEGHPLGNLQGASLRQVLDAHHEHCVQSAIAKARERTERRAKERLDARMAADWEKERKEVLGRGVPGSRFLIGGAASAGGLGEGGGVASRVPLLEGGSASALAIGAAAGSSPYANVVPSPQVIPNEAEGLIKSHLAVIDKRLAAPRGGNNGAALLTALQESLKDAAAATTAGLNPEAVTGYSNALSLVRSIAGVDSAFPDEDAAAASAVLGACRFFAGQFAGHVRESVREAELAGRRAASTTTDALLSSAARDICAFASLAAGRDVVEGRGGVWPQLFYCLRCGDLTAAKSVVDQFGGARGSGGDDALIDPAVASVVAQLADAQQTKETVFGDPSTLLRPSPALLQSRRQVSDLYERAKTSSQSSTAPAEPCAPYRTACLALLGGAESISEAAALESTGLVATVEDYLYGSLWHALHLADGASSGMAGGGGEGLRKVTEAVARLGVLVKTWGPSYFEREEDASGGLYASASAAVALAARGGTVGGATGDRAVPPSGGWAYALPLLAAQQYASALAYLAEAGGGVGLLQAAHVGVAMDAVGLTIADYSSNEPSASSQQQAALLPMLVASYSASLQGVDAAAALKYLVLLSDKGRFVREQVQRLLLETRQFDALCGKVQPDGTRSNGALDAHFSRSEVSSLLLEAANQANRSGKPADAAELLVLAGQYGALFDLMNRELASYLNATTPEDMAKRQFWFNAASQFHALHLSNGRNYVQSVLSAEGSMHLGNTFQLLMNLVVFFDRCRDNQWEGAWALMDTLALVPRTDAEMTVKREAYHALDNCVKRVFHHVVLAAMEALCHIYRNLKQDGGAGAGGADRHSAIEQNLTELRSRARLLVTFARLLNLPSLGDGDTYVRISQLEKNMM